jgi:hypothetical protein
MKRFIERKSFVISSAEKRMKLAQGLLQLQEDHPKYWATFIGQEKQCFKLGDPSNTTAYWN